MSERQYKMPVIVWLRMTGYMHGWLQSELGCALRVGNQKVVCIFDVPGARDVLKMETVEELMEQKPVGNSMSATWKNCIEAGLEMDAEATERMYGITGDGLKQFVPIECPKRCLTANGVLRPWTNDVNLGNSQASALQRVLRAAFWDAVGKFAGEYAKGREGKKYAQVEMIEAFCQETKTPELYVDSLRREWQRRVKRAGSHPETR